MRTFRVCQLGAVLALALAVGIAQAAPPKSAFVVLKEGDLVGSEAVTILNSPFTNGKGRVGFVGGTSSDRFIWYGNGPIFFGADALPDVLTGGEGTMGIGDNAEFIYSPSINGNDGVWGNNGKILAKGDPAPDLPEGWNNTFNSRPQMIDDGTAYWVAGFDDTGGTSTKGRVLYRQPQGGAIQSVLRSDDVVDGETIARSSGVDFDYHVSGGGLSMINVLQVTTGSTTDDDRVLVNGSFVAGETWPTGQGDNWDNFDHVSINDAGNYAFSGDTDGDAGSDEFIAYNGEIALREGTLVDGLTLGASVDALSINEWGMAAFVWDSDLTETLFYGRGSNLLNAFAVLSVSDEIDIDDDAIADYVVTDFKASGVIGPGLDLAESGFVYVEVDIEPVAGGDSIEAIIGLRVPEPGTMALFGIGLLGALRRRR